MKSLYESILDDDDKIIRVTKANVGKNLLETTFLTIINPLVEIMKKCQCRYIGTPEYTNQFIFEEKDPNNPKLDPKKVSKEIQNHIESIVPKHIIRPMYDYGILLFDFVDPELRKTYHRSGYSSNDRYALNIEITFHSAECRIGVFGNDQFIQTFRQLLEQKVK